MKGLSDMELLDAYARERSEEAFRELVARHIDFTYSAAVRLLRNPHLAHEATQSACAIFQAGIPSTSLAVLDTRMEYDRMKRLGVKFRTKPIRTGPTTIATFDDTCGNLIQVHQR